MGVKDVIPKINHKAGVGVEADHSNACQLSSSCLESAIIIIADYLYMAWGHVGSKAVGSLRDDDPHLYT